MRARRLTVLATAATAAVALALAGCSSGSGPDKNADSPTASSSAAAQPDASASAAPSDEATEDGPKPASGDLTASSFAKEIAAASADAGSYKFTMKTSAGGTDAMVATGAVVTDEGSPAVSMKMDVGGMKVEVRYVDDVWYMNYGDMTQNKFVKIDPKTDDSDMAKQFESMTSQMDPAAGLEATKDAITSVTKKGAPITIDGVQAQPYEVVVDPSKVTGPMGDQFKAAVGTVPDELTYTYWIGDDHLMRRMTFELAGSSTEMTLTGWNSDVSVKAPKASEITDLKL